MKTARAASAFDGEGAREFGGRWNSPGTPLVYTAASVSLAALEMLVHTQDSTLLDRYSLIRAEFDDGFVKDVDPALLPANWNAYPAPVELQQIGDQWAVSARSVVLRVPSAVVSVECNYLVNPRHPDFQLIALGQPQPFEFDPRLVR